MKYLLLDTNIYIDMIVSRNQTNTADTYELLKKLLAHDQVQIILPTIVEAEIKRHISNEIEKVGDIVKRAKQSIGDIYWLNHVEELQKFNEKIKPVSQTLTKLAEEFDKNIERYKSDANRKIDELLNYKNVMRIEENEQIIQKVQKRKIYKFCPFHVEEKESWADALIIETLINIRDVINISDEDQIYFVTRNTSDFSKGTNKLEKELIHPHLEEDLRKNNLYELFNYRLFYTKTLIEDFSEETKEAEIYEQLIEEAEAYEDAMRQDYLQQFRDMQRQSMGLSSLGSDEYYIDQIKEDERTSNLIKEIMELSNLYTEIELLIDDDYTQLEQDLQISDLRKLRLNIEKYNLNSPFLQINYNHYFSDEEVIEMVLEFVNEQLCPIESLIAFRDSIIYNDYFEIGELFSFNDGLGNTISLQVDGVIEPMDYGIDTISVELMKNGNRISNGAIEVHYGFATFDEEERPSDSSEETTEYYLDDLIKELNDLIPGYINSMKEIRTNLNTLRSILGV